MRGTRVKVLRQMLNLTQQELEDRLIAMGYELRRARISIIERQENISVEDNTLYGLAKALQVSPSYLMGEEMDTPLIDDAEIRLFFSDDWDKLDPSEKEWIRRAIRIAKDNLLKSKFNPGK